MTSPSITVILLPGREQAVREAIDSVRAQDHAAERVEIVRPARVEQGLRDARGELIAFLDPARPWLPRKLAHQVALLRERPEVGLVYGDEAMVTGEGLTFAASAFRQLGVSPLRGRPVAELLERCWVPAATILFRASLVGGVLPFPAVEGHEGWWLTARIAELAAIDYVPVAVTRRSDREDAESDARRSLELRRWMLRTLDLTTLSADDLVHAWKAYLSDVAHLTERSGTELDAEIPVSEADREASKAHAEAAERAHERGDAAAAVRQWLAARAANPFDGRARVAFEGAVESALFADTASSGPADGTLAERVDWAEERYGAGDVEPAIAELASVAALVEDGELAARVHADLAVIAFELGRVADARAAARTALRHDSGHVAALETLGRCARATGDHFQSAHWLRRAAEAEPSDPTLWAALGAAEHSAARFESAIDALTRAAALAPLSVADEDRLRSAERWAAAGSARAELPTQRDPRRLLLCVDFFYPSVGGLEHIAEGVGASLQELGWTVEIACRALRERTELTRRGMAIHELEGDGDGPDSGRAEGLRNLVANGSYDAVLAFSDPAAWPVPAVLGLPPGPRVIVVPCITAHSGAGVRRTEVLARYRASLERADVIVHNSERGFDAWLNRDLGVDGVYVPQAIAKKEPEGSLRAELGIGEDEPMLLYVANMHPHKNHAGLLEALVDHPGDWRLVLSGFPSPGVPQEAVRVASLARRDPRVTVVPGGLPPARVAAAMRDADLFVCPSHSDAVPLVIQESMAHGLPWIATPGCGAVHDWAGGLILPVEDFGTAIDHLLERRESLAALGTAGRAHWEACFHYGVAAQCYDALLRGASAVPDFPAPASALAETDAIRRDVYEALIGAAAPVVT